MNIFILKDMRYLDNPELFTVAEMRENATDAYATYSFATASAVDYVAATAAAYAFAATSTTDSCADSVAATTYDADYDYTNYWIDEYFKITGEDRQLYINEVERLR
tara:strand:+ start:330 stop:647 length:318 start_codon:yes stop_codon:yes gene_type:complete